MELDAWAKLIVDTRDIMTSDDNKPGQVVKVQNVNQNEKGLIIQSGVFEVLPSDIGSNIGFYINFVSLPL